VHVALISGRTAADLAGRARVGGATYLGDHGVERGRLARARRAEGLRVEVVAIPDRYHAMAERLADRVPPAVDAPWLVVERKTPSVTFHFRTAPDLADAARRVVAAIDEVDPEGQMVRFMGRRAIELRAPGAPAKGEAMRWLLDVHRPAVAFMLGDDRHDALAFRALAAARADGELRTLSLAVAAHPDILPDVAEHADLVVACAVDVAAFLAGLARRLGPGAS
jgi:trehalose-phosphatase